MFSYVGERGLMHGLWALCITFMLIMPLHFICALHGYWLCSRGTGGPSRGSLWLNGSLARVSRAPTRGRVDARDRIMDLDCFSTQWQVGMGLGSRLSYVGPKNRYVVILVLALLYVVRVTCFACTCGIWSRGVCSISL